MFLNCDPSLTGDAQVTTVGDSDSYLVYVSCYGVVYGRLSATHVT